MLCMDGAIRHRRCRTTTLMFQLHGSRDSQCRASPTQRVLGLALPNAERPQLNIERISTTTSTTTPFLYITLGGHPKIACRPATTINHSITHRCGGVIKTITWECPPNFIISRVTKKWVDIHLTFTSTLTFTLTLVCY